ncbi:MAG: TraR/DksA C4-type zinc finger protein [Chitinophagaceae bacterium]
MATKKKVEVKDNAKGKTGAKKSVPIKKAAEHVAPTPVIKKPVKPSVKEDVKKAAAKKPASVTKPSSKQLTSSKVPNKPVITTKKTESAKAPARKKAEPKPVEIARAPADEVTSVPAVASKPVKKEAAPKASKTTIPEIKTKTVRKYEPDFTKSVLDTPLHDTSAPSQRYSDVDLAEFRELINKKIEAAKKELNYLQGLITRKDEMGGDESDNRYMTMEDGSISMEREQLSQMASRQITFIDHLEKAIMRIENKTYGICRVTGKLIDKARLRAVPHATLSIEAKHMQHR